MLFMYEKEIGLHMHEATYGHDKNIRNIIKTNNLLQIIKSISILVTTMGQVYRDDVR